MKLSALDHKLSRDLWRLRGQVVAIAFVVASGVAVLVMALSTLTSLRATTDAYYERYLFAEAFATVKRAPERLVKQIEAIPGVQTAETRVSSLATVDVAGMPEPVVGRLISLPASGQPLLNQMVIRRGRSVEPNRTNEVVVLEPFAEAHNLDVGDVIKVLINGSKRSVKIVGIALSPEFVYALAPGMLVPDDSRFAVIWMSRDALAAAFDLKGAFNSVVLALTHGAEETAVIQRLDRILERYGGTGAIARADQISNWFLQNELAQLKTTATILPGIFLAAAAFLTNTVIARLIATERREISLLKAFGYTGGQIGIHYAKLSVAMALIGIILGWLLGAQLGHFNTELYATIQFRFPFLHFKPSGVEFALSAVISLVTMLSGAMWAVRQAVHLPPAEAMRPPTPESFKECVLMTSITRRLDSATRMMLRHVVRRPWRAISTVTGITLSIAVLMMALQWPDAIDELAESHFFDSQHHDVTVGFYEPRAYKARFELARMPGVEAVQPARMLPADFHGPKGSHRGTLTGYPEKSDLETIFDTRGWVLPVPRAGIVLGTLLAEKLGVGVGDVITIRIRHGAQPIVSLPITGLTETHLGMPAYINLARLNREMGDAPVFDFAHLLIDPRYKDELFARLKNTPAVSAVTTKRSAVDKFHETVGETLLIFVSFFVGFACALVIGVIYNAIRVSLSERDRELATLRVLGFTSWEISYILLGESALLIFLSIPLGYFAGMGLILIMAQGFETELFRIPIVLYPATFGFSIIVALGASVLAAALVLQRIVTLDLISVLKTRE